MVVDRQHIADLDVADQQIARPAGIVGIGLGHFLSDGAGLPIFGERRPAVASGNEQIADFDMAYEEITLRAGIIGLGLGHFLGDGVGLPIFGERGPAIADANNTSPIF